jgi:NDP-sugar pyrophosphorylase family protein
MDPNIVILAAGKSSRMKAHGAPVPGVDPSLVLEAGSVAKSMLGVGPGSRPFMDYVLLTVMKAGYRDVVIVVGDGDNAIPSRYGEGRAAAAFPRLRLTFVVQDIPRGRSKPLGTADALLRALRARPDWEGRRCTVCNSDNLYSIRALRLLLEDSHTGAMIDYDRSALEFPAERIAHFSVIRKDVGGFLRTIIEKPGADEIASAADDHGRVGVSMNIFRFSCSVILPVLEGLPMHPVREERELPAAVQELVRRDAMGMFTIPLAEHVIDLTSRADIPAVQAYLRREFPESVFGPGGE